MTTFAVKVVSGQIPGWLGAYNNLVFAVPTELISADNLIPIEQLDMWNTAGPYAPGQGKISQGHITINKVDTKKIHMTIYSPDLNWDILKGQHTFRLGNQNKIPELNFYGAIK